MPRATENDMLVPLLLTPDEAMRLYHTFVNGLQGPDDKVRQSLAVKVEKARAQAQNIRALVASGKIKDGQKASAA